MIAMKKKNIINNSNRINNRLDKLLIRMINNNKNSIYKNKEKF